MVYDMSSDKKVVASFVAYRRLTIGVSGQGSTNPPSGTNTHPHGTRVTITASPASGWKFDRWLGALSGSSSVGTITMSSDKSVVASFVARQVKKETQPSYIANRNSKEVHKADCPWVNHMKDKNKIPCRNLNEVARMISNEGYNGCFYCLAKYDRDTLTAQQVLSNIREALRS